MKAMERAGLGPIDDKRAKELEARAAFKGLLSMVGPDLVERALSEADENQERGLKGLTLPTEDHSVSLAIDEDGVSFSVGEWRGFHVSSDTAVATIAEIRAEQVQANEQPKP